MAARVCCYCSAILFDVGARVACPASGVPAVRWLVRGCDGRLAGAASMSEALLTKAFAGELRVGGMVVATS